MYKVTKDELLLDSLVEHTRKKRNDCKNLLKYKSVQVNGEVQTYHAFELHSGDEVEVGKKTNLPFELLYEDDDMIVINKPSGLVSEETRNNKYQTAFYMVMEYCRKKRQQCYLVHRLDQDTSGVLMFVKNKKLYQELTHNWNKYVKTRGYVAILEGQCRKSGTIKNHLVEDKQLKMRIAKEGQLAITHYKPLEVSKDYTMMEVFLDTGRKNQIRVHMASLNHPIIGDRKYGACTNPLKRLGLHAHEFAFTHPFTHKIMTFKAPLPSSFKQMFKPSKR